MTNSKQESLGSKMIEAKKKERKEKLGKVVEGVVKVATLACMISEE